MLLPLALLLAPAAWLAPPAAALPTTEILARVAEEAAMLARQIPETLTEETLEQRIIPIPETPATPRSQPSSAQTRNPGIQVHQIVSEYTVGTFQETDSRDLHEFRQVVSVDGREVRSAENARHALSMGVHSEDDRIRKRMLEDFAGYGLVNIASDYALILLEFSKRGQPNLDVRAGETANIGAEPALAFLWKQKSDTGGQIEFAGKRTVRRALQGVLWVRQSDGLPLRVEAWAEYTDQKHVIRDRAAVDYAMSPHGFLAPVSVLHRHFRDGLLITENVYRYQPFKMFSSDAEIKFTEVPEPPPAEAKPPVRQ